MVCGLNNSTFIFTGLALFLPSLSTGLHYQVFIAPINAIAFIGAIFSPITEDSVRRNTRNKDIDPYCREQPELPKQFKSIFTTINTIAFIVVICQASIR